MLKLAPLLAVLALAGCGSSTPRRDTAKQSANYITQQRPHLQHALCATVHTVGIRLANATFDGSYNATPYGQSNTAAPADQVFVELFARCPKS